MKKTFDLFSELHWLSWSDQWVVEDHRWSRGHVQDQSVRHRLPGQDPPTADAIPPAIERSQWPRCANGCSWLCAQSPTGHRRSIKWIREERSRFEEQGSKRTQTEENPCPGSHLRWRASRTHSQYLLEQFKVIATTYVFEFLDTFQCKDLRSFVNPICILAK